VPGVLLAPAALLLADTELTTAEVDGLLGAELDAADPSGGKWTSVPLGYI
jgi:hypothetical protein